MEQLTPWLGDLNDIPALGRHWVGLIAILASVVCGATIGAERELRDKPAGLRTLILIAMGSTIFTLLSVLLAEGPAADPTRIASQILPGIGFLGAGAILHSRGAVLGLTTGATIWAVAAVGALMGSGRVAAGMGVTVLILGTLTAMGRVELLILGPCRVRRVVVTYATNHGKTLPLLQEMLDRHRVPEGAIAHAERDGGEATLTAEVCVAHREHRLVLKEIAELGAVRGLATLDS